MPELPYDALVSEAAKERWVRWHADLKLAERKARKNGQHPSCWKIREPMTAEDEAEQERMRREHTKNLMAGYPELSGSKSPTTFDRSLYYAADDDSTTSPSNPSMPNSDFSMTSSTSDARIATPESVNSDHMHGLIPTRPASIEESSRSAFINSTQKVPTLNQFRDPSSRYSPMGRIAEDGLMADPYRSASRARRSWGDGSGEDSESTPSAATTKTPERAEVPVTLSIAGKSRTIFSSSCDTPLPEKAQNVMLTPTASIPLYNRFDQEEDHITDTVGAIAVDGWGNISCAASSGGIGMKYRGRVGPAALVGVGAAVIPRDPDDSDETCVATVTSGTGEHMATTMAATVCAERLYQSVKKHKGGEYIEVTEDEALKSMIENEFMGKMSICKIVDQLLKSAGHPSVKHSNSAGAIGILGVKKTRQGVMLYYGHNTDSFAMASMHADEESPLCTMSRNNVNGQVAQGGRMMRYQRKKKPKTTPKTTPTLRLPYV